MTPLFPPLVYTVWHATVVLAAVLLVPVAVYWLHSLWRAATSIRIYTRESAAAARGIESNTSAIPALDSTIQIATEVLVAAESVAAKLDTLATVLERRAGRRA